MAQEYKLKGVSSLSLQPGHKQEVEVEGLDAKVLLLNADGKVHATGAKCTHYGAPMVKGVLTKDGRLTCPWHGACFNGKTGDIENAPALDALPIFKVAERDGAVYLTGEEAAIKGSRRRPDFKCAATSGGPEDKVVVVGGGSGALGAVEGLREKGFSGPITMISSEGYLPIDRTKLSKALIADPAKVEWRDRDWFKSGKVELVEDEVADVDFAAKTVATKKGEKIAYGKLILATGSVPRNLPLQGFGVLGNIFTLRTIHDTKKITAALGEKKGKKIVVIGSSFIGMEVANATAADNDVTIVGMGKVAMQRVLGEQVGAAIQKSFEGKGIKFYMSAGVDKAEPAADRQADVGSVVLKDGTRLPADLVVLGVGVAPATGFLRNNKVLKLEKDGSIKTDEYYSVVGVRDVYAVGDIATFPYHGPGGDGRFVRIEHWNVAQMAGRAAAAHIARPALAPLRFTPIFWSALTAQLRYCGNTMASGWDDLVLQGSLDEGKWVGFYCKGDVVVAMASMGADPAMAQSAELMRLGKMPSKKQLQGGLDVVSLGVI